MTVGEAKAIARQWALDHSVAVPGLQGVLFGGSINALPEDAEYDPLSDIDLWHLVSQDVSSVVRQRRLVADGVLLEPAYLPFEAFQSAETVLASWILAGHLAAPSVILDPSGRLAEVHRTVAEEYPKSWRILQRLDLAEAELRGTWLTRLSEETPLSDRLFALGYFINTLHQLPILATLGLPTLRKSGMLFTQMMIASGQEPLSEKRLELLGSARMSGDTVEGLFLDGERAYDRALEIHQFPMPGDFDLSPESRPFMVGGARDLIERGYHREAVLWILFMHWIAHAALEMEAAEECAHSFEPAFRRLAENLGILSVGSLESKARLAEEVLSGSRAIAQQMVECEWRPFSPWTPPARTGG